MRTFWRPHFLVRNFIEVGYLKNDRYTVTAGTGKQSTLPCMKDQQEDIFMGTPYYIA